MRHGNKVNNLGRKSAHRKAMLSNMACSLIQHKRITTTVAKAKALRLYVEPLLTKSKSDTTHSRRVVFSYLKSKEAASELFRDVAPKVMDRPGGYTRIIKLPNRQGDNAEMAIIELVDFNELLLGGTDTKKKTRRRGGSTAKKVTETKVEDAKIVEETLVVEETKTEEPTATAEDTTEEPKTEE